MEVVRYLLELYRGLTISPASLAKDRTYEFHLRSGAILRFYSPSKHSVSPMGHPYIVIVDSCVNYLYYMDIMRQNWKAIPTTTRTSLLYSRCLQAERKDKPVYRGSVLEYCEESIKILISGCHQKQSIIYMSNIMGLILEKNYLYKNLVYLILPNE